MDSVKIEFKRAEHELLVLCSKLSLTEQEENRVKSLIGSNIDFDYLFILAKKHKILQLISRHLIQLDVDSKISSPNKFFMNAFYLGVKRKNERLFKELRDVISKFDEFGLHTIPLKGSQLASTVYQDLGLRSLNDFDFLIPLKERQAVSDCLKSIGYHIGMYNWSKRNVDSISREEELMWKMHVGNLYPHTKVIDDPFSHYISIDFSYNVDLQKSFSASKLLLDASSEGELLGVRTHLLDNTDFLIHLCIHLYKEATNVQWVLYHADLNLIKFCDVREYVLAIQKDLNPAHLCERTKQLGAKEAVFYTFYYLDYLYGEQFTQRFIQDIEISDRDYLGKYGSLDYDTAQIWRKSFYDRFFALNNMDELQETSKLEKIKELY